MKHLRAIILTAAALSSPAAFCVDGVPQIPTERSVNPYQIVDLAKRLTGSGDDVSVILFTPPNSNADITRSYIKAGNKLHVTVEIIEIETPKDAVAAIRRSGRGVRLIIFHPFNGMDFGSLVKPVLLSSYQHGIGVVGFDESFVKAGAVASVQYTQPGCDSKFSSTTKVDLNERIARALKMNTEAATNVVLEASETCTTP